jgi:hypothetical protein
MLELAAIQEMDDFIESHQACSEEKDERRVGASQEPHINAT